MQHRIHNCNLKKTVVSVTSNPSLNKGNDWYSSLTCSRAVRVLHELLSQYSLLMCMLSKHVGTCMHVSDRLLLPQTQGGHPTFVTQVIKRPGPYRVQLVCRVYLAYTLHTQVNVHFSVQANEFKFLLFRRQESGTGYPKISF
jgi:hypothetical protein